MTEEVSLGSPLLMLDNLPSRVQHTYQLLNSDVDLEVVEWARGVFA